MPYLKMFYTFRIEEILVWKLKLQCSKHCYEKNKNFIDVTV